MSYSKNARKLPDIKLVPQTDRHEDEGEVNACNASESCSYAEQALVFQTLHKQREPQAICAVLQTIESSIRIARMVPVFSPKVEGFNNFTVTVSKKSSGTVEEAALCAGQKSFISIHSTDQLCQVADVENPANLEECNVEVLSLNEVFPSTSEESLSNDDEPAQRKQNRKKNPLSKPMPEKTTYVPTNSKSSTGSGRQKDPGDAQPSVYSDFDIPKSTMYVIGSDPGEPKKSYQDPPKKISKTMKKFLRNIDKHKNDQSSKSGEKQTISKLTMRSILKDGRCGPECTGDSVNSPDEYGANDLTLPYMDFEPTSYTHYGKQNPDKNVTFNTQVVIIHFTGDLCVGQSVETLSKEKDQQARNSELRKTFLTKYNEHWPTQK